MSTVIPLDLDADPDLPDAIAVRVVAEIDGTIHSLIVDTGGARSGLVDGPLTAGLERLTPQDPGGGGVFSRAGSTERVTARELRIGDLVIERPVLDLEPNPAAPSLLGLDVLRRLVGLPRLSSTPRGSDGRRHPRFRGARPAARPSRSPRRSTRSSGPLRG
ncbi:hypothetical protein QE428_001570 [Microbacterium sp. SORGH_AS 505]|uniref:retroviral-like aspartic protease family protein n=1 Tax=unclassified Microbacterium TaxID=2609290 RepID=UPI000AB693BF|nr:MULTISPECIES: retroviral-like aspartic protease family protein [unclassified Microbacterium]MDQ1126537.1 hypothetical protein [Microbacterium sp. SORGH_AS_0505]